MISGATYTLPLNIRYPLQNTEKIIITLKNESTGIKRTKHYPNNEETWLMADGRIGVRLTQQDTIDLVGYVKIEAQINLKSGAVAKTKTERTYIASTLDTEIVEGAMDNGEVYLDGVAMEMGDPVIPIDVFADDENAVHYTTEEKTDEEKERARENIGAISEEDAKRIAKSADHYHANGITSMAAVTVKSAVLEGDETISLTAAALIGYIMKGQLIDIGGEYYKAVENSGKASSNTILDIKITPKIRRYYSAGTVVDNIFGATIFI